MNHQSFPHVVAVLLVTGLFFFSPAISQQTEREKIAKEMEHSRKKELLDKWYPQSVDSADGGFITAYTYDFKPTGPQDKMLLRT